MPRYDPYYCIHDALQSLYTLSATASALAITRAFMDVRREMHALLDSVDDDEDITPYQPAGRIIEQLYHTELVAYLQGDDSARLRLLNKVKQAEKLLP
jgi:hypothetical protein